MKMDIKYAILLLMILVLGCIDTHGDDAWIDIVTVTNKDEQRNQISLQFCVNTECSFVKGGYVEGKLVNIGDEIFLEAVYNDTGFKGYCKDRECVNMLTNNRAHYTVNHKMDKIYAVYN